MKNFFEELKEFMFSGNMAKTSASYAIGAATADFSKVITFSLLIPCIQMAWAAATFRESNAYSKLDGFLVLEHLLYWFCVIFVAYVLAELFFSQAILGIKTTINKDDKQKLKVAEHEADKRAEEIKDATSAVVTTTVAKAVGTVTPGGPVVPAESLAHPALEPAPPVRMNNLPYGKPAPVL
jgi:large-conductance mechanosensitive channel